MIGYIARMVGCWATEIADRGKVKTPAACNAEATGVFADHYTRGTSMTPTDLAVIERRISGERLAPYRAQTDGHLGRAIDLYQWNADAAAAFWVLLGHLEILIRNAMHEQLAAWSLARYGQSAWYVSCSAQFNAETRQDVAVARRRATAAGRTETQGQVIAELPLGFWKFLLAGRYERVLWRTCLYRGFPGQGRRRAVFDKLSGLHLLRNRIAHHEPVHNRSLGQLHEDALDIAGWICPVARTWIASQSRVPDVLLVRPKPGP